MTKLQKLKRWFAGRCTQHEFSERLCVKCEAEIIVGLEREKWQRLCLRCEKESR